MELRLGDDENTSSERLRNQSLIHKKLVAADDVVGLPCLAGFKGIPSVRSVAR